MHGDGARENGDGSRDGRGRRRRRRRGRGGRGGEGREGGPFPAASRARFGRSAASSRTIQRKALPRLAMTSMRPAICRRSKALRGRIRRAARPTPTAMANPVAGVADGVADGAIAATAQAGRNGDFAAAPGPEIARAPDYSERPDRSPPREAGASAGPRSQPMRRRFEPVPRPEPAPQPAASAPDPQPAGDREPPRRRSTVREPAPVFSGSAPAVTPTPMTAPPPPAPVVSSTAEADSKPKRSGWWAKRLLGGD